MTAFLATGDPYPHPLTMAHPSSTLDNDVAMVFQADVNQNLLFSPTDSVWYSAVVAYITQNYSPISSHFCTMRWQLIL